MGQLIEASERFIKLGVMGKPIQVPASNIAALSIHPEVKLLYNQIMAERKKLEKESMYHMTPDNIWKNPF